MTDKLSKDFENVFGVCEHKELFFSPGRVNLIGEHTDYNGGYVFPCALNLGTYAVVGRRNDSMCRILSENIKNCAIKSFDINDTTQNKSDGWLAYEKGVIDILKKEGYKIEKGFDMLMYGTLPNGAGLSSSASVEVLTGLVASVVNDLDIDMVTLVKIAQKAENNYVGVQCGIMDQFAVGMGKKDHAILLDCNTLKFRYAPIVLKDASIVIGNTNKKRGLAGSKYNERRNACEAAIKTLNEKGIQIKNLCDLSVEKFNEVKKYLTDREQLIRARHAVTENARTLEAVSFLENGNIEAFGKLMNESHVSLRDDYEVSCFELDTLVAAAWETEGVIGSRMTGAGFGGCTVNLVKNASIDIFKKEVGKKYLNKTGIKADFYVATIGDGTKKTGEL